ncbi:MAG: hypothetical protein R2851_21675 [Caldilineaceae bacterium]
MQAHAELTITDQEEDGTFVGQIVMLDPFVCSADLENNQESIADTAELAEALTTPLVFKQRKNGVIASVSYASDASATVINLQKGIINALQATLQETIPTRWMRSAAKERLPRSTNFLSRTTS